MMFAGMDIADVLKEAPTKLLNVGANAEQIMLAGAEEITSLRACLKQLIDKVELVGKESVGVFQIAALHGCKYIGPNLEDEIGEAHAVLRGNARCESCGHFIDAGSDACHHCG